MLTLSTSDTSINPAETGLYYLNSRYYSPEFGRFINADGQLNGDLLGYNLFLYCGNNPVNNQDFSGQFWDIALDVVFTVGSLIAVAKNPTDLKAWAALGADLICTFIPFATGGGIAVRAASKVDDVIDAGRAMNKADNVADAGRGLNKAEALAGGLCFVAGTLVLTENGKENIEDIKTGDKVYAENPETGEKGLKEVVQTFINETNELIHIQIEKETISTTPEHPFYVKNEGWISAKDLRAGDILVLQDGGYAIVEKTQHEILESPIKVYNFEVEDYHTYYVGDNGVLVHNTCHTNHYPSANAAMRAAKRSENIPMSQLPNSIEKVKMLGENGQVVYALQENYVINGSVRYIRNDLGGHIFKDGETMGRHYNAGRIVNGKLISNNIHFFY